MEDHIPINVWLGGRSYRLLVKPEEESAIRKSVKVADDMVTEMRQHYAGKDDQDFMAMSLLTYATDTAIESFNNPLLQHEMKKMEAKIDKVIGKENL